MELTNETPILCVREGDISGELLRLVDEEHDISLPVLGAGTKSGTAGPLIIFLWQVARLAAVFLLPSSRET